MRERINPGDVFARLAVLRRDGSDAKKNAVWLCRCACGRETRVAANYLRTGHVRSCGCLRSEVARAKAHRHGMYGTRSYRCWRNMKSRCLNPAVPEFVNYGGRGVTVCERWHDFAAFLADMGPCPPGHSIDRVDNDGDYEPGNCRWATDREQRRNKRNTRLLTHGGRTRCLADWAADVGITTAALWLRLERGLSVSDALTTPPRYRRRTTTPRGTGSPGR